MLGNIQGVRELSGNALHRIVPWVTQDKYMAKTNTFNPINMGLTRLLKPLTAILGFTFFFIDELFGI